MFLLLSSKYYFDIETPFTVINIVIEQILRCYRNKKMVITLKLFNVIVTKPCYHSEIDNPGMVVARNFVLQPPAAPESSTLIDHFMQYWLRFGLTLG